MERNYLCRKRNDDTHKKERSYNYIGYYCWSHKKEVSYICVTLPDRELYLSWRSHATQVIFFENSNKEGWWQTTLAWWFTSAFPTLLCPIVKVSAGTPDTFDCRKKWLSLTKIKLANKACRQCFPSSGKSLLTNHGF